MSQMLLVVKVYEQASYYKEYLLEKRLEYRSEIATQWQENGLAKKTAQYYIFIQYIGNFVADTTLTFFSLL